MLKDKIIELQVLATRVESLQKQLVPRETRAAIQEVRDRYEFRWKELDKEFQVKVQELTEEYAEREWQVKKDAMTKEYELLKQ